MRVLGIDPGLTRCGLGVVEGEPGRPLRLVAVDVVRTRPTSDLPRRLLAVHDAVADWIDRLPARTRWRSSGSSASTTCAP